MKVYKKVTDLIGGTPLLELVNYEKQHDGSLTLSFSKHIFKNT